MTALMFTAIALIIVPDGGLLNPVAPTRSSVGSILFGVATQRANVFPRNAGLLFILGALLWLVAFFLPVPFLLSIANLLSAVGLTWMGVSVYPRKQTDTV